MSDSSSVSVKSSSFTNSKLSHSYTTDDSILTFGAASKPSLKFENCRLFEKLKRLNIEEIISNRRKQILEWNEYIKRRRSTRRSTVIRKVQIPEDKASNNNNTIFLDMDEASAEFHEDELRNMKIKVLVLHNDKDSEILQCITKLRECSQCFKDILLLDMIDIVIFENVYSLYEYLLALQINSLSNIIYDDASENVDYDEKKDMRVHASYKSADSSYMNQESNSDVLNVNTRDIVKIITVNLINSICDAGHSIYLQHQTKSNESIEEDQSSEMVISSEDFNVRFLNDLMLKLYSINESFDVSIIESNIIEAWENDLEDGNIPGKFEMLPLPLFGYQFRQICDLHSSFRDLVQKVIEDSESFQYEDMLTEINNNQNSKEVINLLSLRKAVCRAFEIKCLQMGVNISYLFFDEFLEKWGDIGNLNVLQIK